MCPPCRIELNVVLCYVCVFFSFWGPLSYFWEVENNGEDIDRDEVCSVPLNN